MMTTRPFRFKVMGLIAAAVFAVSLAQAQVNINDSQLQIDGVKQSQLYGAEVQYFRLRGAYGKNVPRAQVIALWNKALDRVVEAKINTVSFYIPWDFHEYQEGKFDFTGTVDEDGDGNPDYPSRDVVTFIQLIKAHGIQHIMVRPGPYINAEWGALGFGAIPMWFHDKYPGSHMMTSWGWKRALYDYLDPQFLSSTTKWFTAVYTQVLKDEIGPGKPVTFLQIDNETNYQWQSLANADFGPRAVARYQDFLKQTYGDLQSVNKAHGRTWSNWTQVQPPPAPGANIGEDQDWYRFNDQTIYIYLGRLRQIWESLGVHEPDVLFTMAESYNAPQGGLLPNYVYDNSPGRTGLLTVNLYPKTYETSAHPLLNEPFKADLDVKSATEAGNAYFGTPKSQQEWAMGPEIQAGWWIDTPVTDEARQQTYLTVIGHGLKAFYLYYFNEGENWDIDWAYNHIKPIFLTLKKEWNVENTATADLSNEFWGELQARSDRQLVMGFSARTLMENDGPDKKPELFFDSPLDPQANPRGHFALIKTIGERVIGPYHDFLGRALEVNDSVALVKDSFSHQPSPISGLDSLIAASDWNASLLGYMMTCDLNPLILQGDLSDESAFKRASVFVHLDTGVNSPRTLKLLHDIVARGQTVINFLSDSVAQASGLHIPTGTQVNIQTPYQTQSLEFFLNPQGLLGDGRLQDQTAHTLTSTGPVFTYDMSQHPECMSILFWQGQTAGYICPGPGSASGQNGNVVQIGAAFFTDVNSNSYATSLGDLDRRMFMQALEKQFSVTSHVRFSAGALKAVAFARKDPLQKLLWVTVKTGSLVPQMVNLSIDLKLLDASISPASAKGFRVVDLLSGQPVQDVSRKVIESQGFNVKLAANGSTVFVIEAR